MQWFQHSTGSHDDPNISDAIDELGDFGYSGFFIVLEIYGDEFQSRDQHDFITISYKFLRRKLRKSSTKVQQLLNFYSKTNPEPRIIHKLVGSEIMLKVPKYIKLASNWTKRTPTEAPTEAPHAKEKNRIEKNRIDKENTKRNQGDAPDAEFVYPEDFENFYSIYPRKKSKGDALVAWKKINPSQALQTKIIEAVKAQTGTDILPNKQSNGEWFCKAAEPYLRRDSPDES